MSVAVPRTVSVETAERDLKHLLEQLHLGETLTLIGPEGAPLAVMVSLKAASAEVEPAADWEAQWEELAEEVGRAWTGEKSAVEVLSEMRR
jgi:hypothetical protein